MSYTFDYEVDLLLDVRRPRKCCGFTHEDPDDAGSIFPMGLAGLHGEWSSLAKSAFDRNVRVALDRLTKRKLAHRVFENLPLLNKIKSYICKYSSAYSFESLCTQLTRQRDLVGDLAYLDLWLSRSPAYFNQLYFDRGTLKERFLLAGWGNNVMLTKMIWFHQYMVRPDLIDDDFTMMYNFQYMLSRNMLRLQCYPSLGILVKQGIDIDAIQYGITEEPPVMSLEISTEGPLVRVVDKFIESFRLKWNCLSLFKLLVVLQQFNATDAAGEDEGLFPKIGRVYVNWFTKFSLFCGQAILLAIEFVTSVAGSILDFLDSFEIYLKEVDPELLALLVLVFMVVGLSALPYALRGLGRGLNRFAHWCCTPTLTSIRVPRASIETGFVESTVRKSDGTHLYNIRCGSKTFQLPGAPKDAPVVMEMAMPGSVLHESAFKPGVFAIVTYSDMGVINLVGMGVRVHDYLVTAAHVANTIFSGTRKPAIVPFKHGVQVMLNNKKIKDLTIEEFNLDLSVDFKNLDVFAIRKTADFWVSVGITKVPLGKPSMYNQQISTVGLENSMLVSAVGKTLRDSGRHILWHTASTNKGFSGGPVFSGTNMVGLHYAAQGDRNEAIRIESILHAMQYTNEETSDLIFTEREDVVWLGGKEGRIENEDGDHVFMGRDGQVIYLNEDYYQSQLHRYEDKNNDYYQDADYSDGEGEIPSEMQDPYGDDPYYDDKGRRTTRNKELAKLSKKKPKLNMERAAPDVVLDLGLNPNIFRKIENKAPVHTGAYPRVHELSVEMLAAHGPELIKRGFVPDSYGEFEITKGAEELSLVKHLAMFEDRMGTIVAPPTEKEIERVLGLAEVMLQHNKFSPDADYDSRDAIRRIIESTLVKGSRSAGYPYSSDGLPRNADAIREYGVEGLIDIVKAEWDNPFDLKVFLKGEPHKKKKISERMLRIITAMPLHKMVKHQALFKELTSVGVANWRNSPIVFFSPQVPGDVENLWRRLSKRVMETDKSNWDFNMFGYVFDILKRIILKLVVRHPDMTDEMFERYKMDVVKAIDEVSVDSVYRCSNGSRYQVDADGIMKSGWVLTYFANSVSQLILHLLVSIRMGLSDVQILSPEMNIFCGGDDVLQSIPDGFDVERCIFEYSQLGVKITDHKIHNSMEGSEFFSNEFYHTDDKNTLAFGESEFWTHEGLIRYRPVRFTKHIYNLRTTAPEFLGAALVSHMMNYCWDMSRYKIFENMFRWLMEHHPELVDVSLFKSNSYWRYKSKGCESAF
jgi:hypothetical protein